MSAVLGIDVPAFALTVLGDPRAKGRPRVVNNRAYTPAATRRAEEAFAMEAMLAMRAARLKPFTGPLVVSLRFFTKTARRVDIDNLQKLVLDSGNAIVWADDSQIVRVDVSKEIDRARPRTELEVRATPAADAASQVSHPSTGRKQ